MCLFLFVLSLLPLLFVWGGGVALAANSSPFFLRVARRPLTLETGNITNANGSSRVQLMGTDVLVGVKLEVVAPAEDKPDQGMIEVSLDMVRG